MNSTSPFSHWNRLFGIPASRSRPQRISRIWHVEQLESRWNLSSPGATNWEMVVDNGAHDNRVDIVFLGDGYTASEIATIYEANIEAMLRHLFDEREDPFPRYRNFFNVTRIDVISADSGVDEPTEGISRDTALNATYRYDGST